MYKSIEIIFRTGSHPDRFRNNSHPDRTNVTIDKPDDLNYEDGILAITKDKVVRIFPLDTIQEVIVVLADDEEAGAKG